MQIREGRRSRAVVRVDDAPWVASPERGVDRVLLERDGGEIARATSVVRFAPGARFHGHVHERGEEILVLDGELRDEHGVYPRGTYLRSAWGSVHRPFSTTGCLLFVKLRQTASARSPSAVEFAAFERCRLGRAEDHSELVLHASKEERASLVRIAAGRSLALERTSRTDELLVLEGCVEVARDVCPARTWLRFAPREPVRLQALADSLVFVKSG